MKLIMRRTHESLYLNPTGFDVGEPFGGGVFAGLGGERRQTRGIGG